MREARQQGLGSLLAQTRRRSLGVMGATGACFLLGGALFLGLSASVLAGLSVEHGPAPGWARALVLAALAAGGGVVGWFFVWRPAREVSSDRSTAAFLESRLPGSAGLASAVQFREELRAGEPSYSRELASEHVSRMSRRARRLDPAPAVPLRPLGRAGIFLLAALSLHSAALLALSDTIGRGYGALLSNGDAIPGMDGQIVSVEELITGDVELVYHYPEYTGLPSRTVSGTGGDIRALKGTEVEVRTRADREVEGAAMVVGESEVRMSVSDERNLQGRLLVSEPGHYRFRFLDSRGRTTAEGPAHRIGVEPDDYPHIEVSVPGHEGADEIEIREQDRLALDYRARDDFGLEKIAIAWRIRGGQEQRAIIRRGGGRDRMEGRWGWDLTALGLAPGDRVAWYLEALDNDTVSGPKRSTTRTHYLKVFSAAEHHRALMRVVEEHWEGMIESLADHLESPFDPPEGALESHEIEEVLAARRLGEDMTRLTDAMAETVAELREDPLSPAALVDALDNIRSGLARANRRYESAVRLFDSHSRARRSHDRAQALRVRAGQDRIVADLENGILYLESLLDKQRLQDLLAMAEEIREHQRRLTDLVEQLRESPDEETRAAISEEIARIKERVHELMERMSELARGIRDEHLNIEAMEQLREQDDLLTGLDDIQRMLEEGDLDDALARLLDMAGQLESMIDGWRDQDEQFGGEQYAELQREVMEFVDELQRVKREQDNLVGESEELRERYRQALEERVEGQLEELIERLTELALRGEQLLAEIPDEVLDHGFGRLDREAVQSGAVRLSEVAQLLGARDFDEARQMAEQALHHVGRASSSFAEQARSAERYQHFMGRRREDLEQARMNADRALGHAQEIVEALDHLFPDPGEVFDQQEQGRMEEMAGRQCDLQGRSRGLEQRMQSIGEQAPLFSPDMEGELREAGRHMNEAKRSLERSDARQAGAHQRAAADRLGELQRQMEEAAERGGQGSGIPMPLAGGSGGRGGPSGGLRQEHVEIPDADQYEAPEQFRRELLEAMREGAPERYQEQVRRYYEELVR